MAITFVPPAIALRRATQKIVFATGGYSPARKSITFVAPIRAFDIDVIDPHDSRTWNQFCVSVDGTIRVFDNVAGYFTSCHSADVEAVRTYMKRTDLR